MTKQKLHGIKRVALSYQTARERPAAAVATVSRAETSGTVKACDIALMAVGREIVDRFTIKGPCGLLAHPSRRIFFPTPWLSGRLD